MNKLLLSACLLGNPVRYDGRAKNLEDPLLQQLVDADRVISFCPEVEGGLPVPRPAAEIQEGDGSAVIAGTAAVRTGSGKTVSEFFLAGASKALNLCQQHGIKVAVLTELSPSCGSTQIYDGSFSRQKIEGVGVTAALLRANDIFVFNQYQLSQAIDTLDGYND